MPPPVHKGDRRGRCPDPSTLGNPTNEVAGRLIQIRNGVIIEAKPYDLVAFMPVGPARDAKRRRGLRWPRSRMPISPVISGVSAAEPSETAVPAGPKRFSLARLTYTSRVGIPRPRLTTTKMPNFAARS